MYAGKLGYASVLAIASYASAATIRVDVGSAGLTFSPNTIKASTGDILDFHFHAINHSVVMGDFSNPCAPAKTGGFFSGFMPVSSGEAVSNFYAALTRCCDAKSSPGQLLPGGGQFHGSHLLLLCPNCA
jgi:plastocyanin